MDKRAQLPENIYKPGDIIEGFQIDAVTEVPDIIAWCYEGRHLKTGAEFIHLYCNDDENLFSVGFSTPPADSTGSPHILEHSVLAGSRKYPLKDAFNELGKASMSTFLNAMTWPDRTVYPVASCIKADYFNLATVYADLVFNPLIAENTFLREGHHLDMDDDGNLTVSGIVYNEMKGAFSTPESVAFRNLYRNILPDTCYANESGGDPQNIPNLTYSDFVEFHHTYYSPSNSRTFFYGNCTLLENLTFLAGVLAPFEKREVHINIQEQPRWKAPRREVISYPLDEGQQMESKSFVTLSWLLHPVRDIDKLIEMSILGEVLYGSDASPVRKALIDSGLGEDIFPDFSYDCDINESLLIFGLRGTDEEYADEIERIIVETLKDLVKNGVPQKLLSASMHQFEIAGREIQPEFPVHLMMLVNMLMFHGGDPKGYLMFSDALKRLQDKLNANPRLFEELIQTDILDNSHRYLQILKPSPTLQKEEDERFRKRMEKQKEALSSDELSAVKDKAKELYEESLVPDSKEVLELLPRLTLNDIPKELKELDYRTEACSGGVLLEQEIFTNGINYFEIAFDTSGIDEKGLMYVPLFAQALYSMGTVGCSYTELAERILENSAGIDHDFLSRTKIDGKSTVQIFSLESRYLPPREDGFFAVVRDILLDADFTNTLRLKEIVKQAYSQMYSRIIDNGDQFAFRRAGASLSHAGVIEEQWQGGAQLLFLKELIDNFESCSDEIVEQMSYLKKVLLVRERVIVSVAAEGDALMSESSKARELLDQLPEKSLPKKAVYPFTPQAAKTGLALSTEVSFNASIFPVPPLVSPDAPALKLLASYISNDILYNRVRLIGGAYGGFAFYDEAGGAMYLGSYRDPHIVSTVETFKDLYSIIMEEFTPQALEELRVSTIGRMDIPQEPKVRIELARKRYLCGYTYEMMQKNREALFTVSFEEVKEVVEKYLSKGPQEWPLCVISSEGRLKEASAKIDLDIEVLKL